MLLWLFPNANGFIKNNDPVQLVLKGCDSNMTLVASCCTYIAYYSMLSTDVHVSIEYLEGSKQQCKSIIHVLMFHSITVCLRVVVFMLLSRK